MARQRRGEVSGENRGQTSADQNRRPLFTYGNEIHEHCERHRFYEADMFVRTWGDSGHRNGWCLLHMGCRGPQTRSNCYTQNWNENTGWPVHAGHGCLGCTSRNFWDRMTPFYRSGED